MHKSTSSLILLLALACQADSLTHASGKGPMKELMQNFRNPPAHCQPHTRWWWMGSAVTKEEITWELEQMRAGGIGGVEQVSMGPVYEKGNIEYLSEEFLEMLKHTVAEAKRLGMEVSLNFGGPGWVIGGAWVPEADRSKDMAPAAVDVAGPSEFSGPLPTRLIPAGRSWELPAEHVGDDARLVAVVAGQVADGRLDEDSLVDLTSLAEDGAIGWQVPGGRWRIMAFWLRPTGQGHAVDHFNVAAMQRYCDHIGGKFYEAFGDEFGKTVESLFCDSFEVANSPGGVYWTDGLLEEFARRKGYDLTRYLPAIWWDIGPLTPKIRYDVNHFLHQIGLEAFFGTFLDWCEKHGVRGRIQPYGFAADNLEGAGLTHLPEMEITAGEKDAVPWFDTRIGPKKYVSSGAHLYGRNVVTTEAYTFMHWETYRSTLEEMKIATDNYLRAGANKFYNHGYCFSPERDVCPSRTIGFAVVLNHTNVWWKHYPNLARYVARCCWLLRRGEPAPDIALYSPLANQWTLDVLNMRRWTRDFDWGELGKLLIANGYDFDLVNDDVLQNRASIEDGMIKVREMKYNILILPDVKALPLETMEFIQRYVREGGTVIALERVPEASVGMADHEARDTRVRAIAAELFDEPRGRDATAPRDYGRGRTYHIKTVMDRSDVLDRKTSALGPFLNTLRAHLPPDFGIDFIREGLRENDGLTFVHRRDGDRDIYFVANLQDRAVDMPVAFRVKGRAPWTWNPYDGEVSREYHFREAENGTVVRIRLAAYESIAFVFEEEEETDHVTYTDLYQITAVTDDGIEAEAKENGTHQVTVMRGGQRVTHTVDVTGVPAPLAISGEWKLTLEADYFGKVGRTLSQLTSWTNDPSTRHFSGTGQYEIDFDLPADYTGDDMRLLLDLGSVGNVAEVALNDQPVGTVWIRRMELDVTTAARAGANRLRLQVTNTLINRVSGMKEPPPVPEELVPHYGSGTTPASAHQRGPIGFEPLPASGLLGPVRIVALKRVVIR